MAIKTTRVTVGTTATPLIAKPGLHPVLKAPPLAVQAPVDMWVGGPDVTPGTDGNGWLVAAGAPFKIDLAYGDVLHAVVASGSTVAQVFQQGA